ncbi:hypothetical protein DFH11DRAFT_1730924 [Phellopilus nigrolimitatus]|nr:hypothetical protein DFH11DRAFT_1730924 [Phellopilus nigrolimitatus]
MIALLSPYFTFSTVLLRTSALNARFSQRKAFLACTQHRIAWQIPRSSFSQCCSIIFRDGESAERRRLNGRRTSRKPVLAEERMVPHDTRAPGAYVRSSDLPDGPQHMLSCVPTLSLPRMHATNLNGVRPRSRTPRCF